MVRSKRTAVDLFSGCGGLSLGLRQAGFDVLAAVDSDLLAVSTYRRNHPDVFVWNADIRSLDAKELLAQMCLSRGELDLLAGCPPCQGFSNLRTKNRAGVDDHRNDLVLDFVRFVRELFPKTVMMENVPGLAKDARLGAIVSEMTALGYEVKADVLDAADYGVPQRRRRFVLVASRVGAVGTGRRAKHRRTVRETLNHRRRQSDPLHDYADVRSDKVLERIRNVPPDGGSRAALPAHLRLRCHSGTDGFKDVYGRMAWDDVAPTITGGCVNPSRGRFLHPEEHRSITLREAALLQTFPADYYFSLEHGKYAAAQMIGNALPPEFIRRHAATLYRVIEKAKL